MVLQFELITFRFGYVHHSGTSERVPGSQNQLILALESPGDPKEIKKMLWGVF